MANKKILERVIQYHEKNIAEWDSLLNKLFPSGIPETAFWDNESEIIETLNAIGEGGHVVHLFFPSGGGLDLSGAEMANEAGCIEIVTEGSGTIVKPDRLIFESYPGQPNDWSYFRLETKELQPISERFSMVSGLHEALVLRTDGQYDDVGHYAFYEPEYNPELIGCRRIARYSKSAFVMFAKSSPYNNIPDTYDGRHNKMNSVEFREYISKMLNLLIEIEAGEPDGELL